MKLSSRQNSIFLLIYKNKSITVKRLVKACPFNRETLRRELVFLESMGLIERSYGKIAFFENETSRRLIQEKKRPHAAERKEQILSILKEHKNVRLTALAARMQVSIITIRSDLAKLVLEGMVVQKHGSVSLFPNSTSLSLLNKTINFPSNVKVIGQHILLHINPGETIYLGSGDIARYAAVSLQLNANIPVVTDNLEIISILRERDYTSPVYILPGKLIYDSGIIEASQAENFLANIKIDKAFFMIFSYADGTYFMENPEAVSNATSVSRFAQKLYFILNSGMLDKRGTYPFPYREYRDKVQEILIDDSVDREVVNYLFSRRDPVVVYGSDYSFKAGRRLKFRIGFLVDRVRGYFAQAVYNSVRENSAAYDIISLAIRESDGGFFSAVKNADLLLNDRPDLIINFTLCPESLTCIEDKCQARGVKLINIDLQCNNSVYFGADNALAGTMAGNHTVDFIQKCWQGQLDRIIIFARHGMDHITNRRVISMVEKIQAEIYAAFPDPEIIEWDHPDARPKEELIRLLMEIPKNNHVLFISFSLTFFLASYDIIVQYRDANNTIIAGQNFNRQVEELMKRPNSPILGCVDYNPEEYGTRVLNLAVRILEGKKVDAVNYITHTWISREEVLAGAKL